MVAAAEVSQQGHHEQVGKLLRNIEVASRSWSFASAVPGQMTHLVANSTLDSANSYVMQVVVILIVRVVIVVVFGIVVIVGGVSSIFKHSFVIVDSFSCYWSSACPGVLILLMKMNTIRIGDLSGVSAPLGDEISSGGKKSRESNIGGGTIAGRAIITWDGGMASYACIYGSSCKGGKNRTKKYRGSNSSDGGNIGDGVRIAGEVIGSGDGIELKELLPDEAGK
ncbi:hypothetical protein Tco_0740176 [Tanacetum coccineum]